jgi:hypothetical protein
MKILHLSKMDSGGGAADGFVRIHQALLGQGVESVAYVLKQRRQDVPMVAAKGLLNPWQKLVWGAGPGPRQGEALRGQAGRGL